MGKSQRIYDSEGNEVYSVYMHRKITPPIMIYIGQTILNPKYRWNKNGVNTYYGRFGEYIDKNGWGDIESTILATTTDLKELYDLEEKFILEYESYKEDKGWNSLLGHRMDETTKRKISEGCKGINSYPHPWMYELNRNRMGQRRGKQPQWLVDKRISKIKKPVMMMDIDGNDLMEFPSSTDCAKWLRNNGYPKAEKSSICSCCNGKLLTAYKHKFRYI